MTRKESYCSGPVRTFLEKGTGYQKRECVLLQRSGRSKKHLCVYVLFIERDVGGRGRGKKEKMRGKKKRKEKEKEEAVSI